MAVPSDSCERSRGIELTGKRAIVATTGNKNVRVSALDLTDLASVARFVTSWDGALDILVNNNAGVMASPETRTPDGQELQVATNHLGHFGLGIGLHSALTAAQHSRVVSVSSAGDLRTPWFSRTSTSITARTTVACLYGRSKTANALFAVAAGRRWGGRRHHRQRGHAR